MLVDLHGSYIGHGILATRPPGMYTFLAAALAVCLAIPQRARAQEVGSLAQERDRLREITGGAAAPTNVQAGLHVDATRLDLRVTWNSAIPYSVNDGRMWAGRGLSTSFTEGFALAYAGRRFDVRAVLAPTLVRSANRDFEIVPGRDSSRSSFSSPWHLGAASADLPLRFGNRPVQAVDVGESSLSLRIGGAEGGLSNTSQWWGPGIRNALLMSNNAGGIPRAYVRTARPMHSRFGDVTAEAFAGTLTESLYFDTLSANDYRAISAFVVSLRPRLDSNLTFGVARAVYQPSTGSTPTLSAAANVFRWTPTFGTGDARRRADQIASVFARWIFPEVGLETYTEWSRMELPRSLSEFVEMPHNTQGYTLGFQWAFQQRAPGHWLRVGAELSFLDQSIVVPDRPPVDFYVGRSAAQGYTQRGQIIGASIGPGGSSQWVAVDAVRGDLQLGLFVGRTRWENDALYRQPFATFLAHDVTIYSGIRGAARLPYVDLSGELSVQRRLNYLFQNAFGDPLNHGTVNVQNVNVTTRITRR